MMTLLCPYCFGDKGLKRRIEEIRPKFPDLQCDFHPSRKGIPASQVARIVDDVFRSLLTFADYNPIPGEPSGMNLTEALYELTELDDDRVAQALGDSLIESDEYWPPDGEEPFYEYDRQYDFSEHGYEEHSRTWSFFRNEILHEQRFFNHLAMDRLREIFDGLHLLRDEMNKPAVYEIKPGDQASSFFRARKSNGIEQRTAIAADPRNKLGPPPEHLRTAGRMNSSGILAFYGAFDLQTCIAELRPAVGETVVSGQFSLNRPILVLDTTSFSGRPKAINVFAKTHMKRMRLWKFMSKFMNEIAQPCLPEDEHIDYVLTQVVSEYLVHHHQFKRSESKRSIDAIIYRSAQNREGKNIALFGSAGSVEGANTSPVWRFRSSQSGMRWVEGSVASHVVSSVAHEAEEILTQTLGVDDFPF